MRFHQKITAESYKRFWALSVFSFAFFTLQAQNGAQPYQGIVGKTLADSKEWWPEPVKAPKDAPNVLYPLSRKISAMVPALEGILPS